MAETGLRMLCVGDCGDLRLRVEKTIGAHAVVDEVQSLAEAAHALGERRYDLCVVAPSIDGRRVVDALEAANIDTGGMPLVLLSADSGAPEAADALAVAAALSGRAGGISHADRLTERFRKAQRMEAIGRLAGSAAHDFNNMLTAIIGYCDLLDERLDVGDSRREDLAEIRLAASRGVALTRQVLAFSRRGGGRREVLDLNQTIKEIEQVLVRVAGRNADVHIELAPELPAVELDPAEAEQILVNLVANARDAMPEGGTITITSSVVEDVARSSGTTETAEPRVQLEVRDTGVGMDEHTRARMFDPFFTTKEPAHGTGLGLTAVRAIVVDGGGVLDVESAPGQGTLVRMSFPTVDRPVLMTDPELLAAVGATQETILLVEDDAAVRHLAQRILEGRGYAVLAAGSASTALDLSAAHLGVIDLLLTDVELPGTNGQELADRIVASRPAARVLFMTGYDESDAEVRAGRHTGALFVRKPFTADTLVSYVRDALASPSATTRE
jgi:two-component system, cell cycle sensor histidine kinase and response regulator CckA